MDALLACGPVRAAYLRRLERVSAAMHGERGGDGGGSGGGGAPLASQVAALASAVRRAAAADDARWRAGDPAAAAARLALLIPARGRQLAEAYGPNGTAAALLPGPQPERGLGRRVGLRPLGGGAVAVCATAPEAAGAEGATDLTGLVATLPGASAVTFPPGAVVPPGGCVVAGPTRAGAAAAAVEAGLAEGGGGAWSSPWAAWCGVVGMAPPPSPPPARGT